MGGFKATGFQSPFGKPMLNSKEAGLQFLGGNGQIRVIDKDSSIIDKGGYGRFWGGL
jgi:hypothetical protein